MLYLIVSGKELVLNVLFNQDFRCVLSNIKTCSELKV